MKSQREELAKHGIDHDKYEVFLSDAASIDDESTGIMVRDVATGREVEDWVGYSRRQLAEEGNTVYIDTIVKLVCELQEGEK